MRGLNSVVASKADDGVGLMEWIEMEHYCYSRLARDLLENCQQWVKLHL